MGTTGAPYFRAREAAVGAHSGSVSRPSAPTRARWRSGARRVGDRQAERQAVREEPRAQVGHQFGLAAPEVRHPADVEEQPVGRIGRHRRRVTHAPMGQLGQGGCVGLGFGVGRDQLGDQGGCVGGLLADPQPQPGQRAMDALAALGVHVQRGHLQRRLRAGPFQQVGRLAARCSASVQHPRPGAEAGARQQQRGRHLRGRVLHRNHALGKAGQLLHGQGTVQHQAIIAYPFCFTIDSC